MNRKPEIRIMYGWLLEPIYERRFSSNPKNKGKEFPSRAHMLEKLEEFKAVWKPLEGSILAGMCDVLGLEFYQNTIDAHFVYSRGSMSNPMIIGYCHGEPEAFVDIFTHEIIHRILTDNTRRIDVRTIWNSMFPGLEDLARNHVLVHAVHEHIYRDVLNRPDRLAVDIEKSETSPSYKKAWEIVKERGYKNIIEEFKSRFV